jgi:uncharacterized protein YfiM (DUF2279 family)
VKKFLIPIDKANHFIAGTMIYCASALFLSAGLALIPVIVLAASKEIYDSVSKKGTSDIADYLFTIAGAIPPLVINL